MLLWLLAHLKDSHNGTWPWPLLLIALVSTGASPSSTAAVKTVLWVQLQIQTLACFFFFKKGSASLRAFSHYAQSATSQNCVCTPPPLSYTCPGEAAYAFIIHAEFGDLMLFQSEGSNQPRNSQKHLCVGGGAPLNGVVQQTRLVAAAFRSFP